MKCRAFSIRLADPQIQRADEQAMNNSLTPLKVKHISSSLVNGPMPYWSVFVVYEETAEEKRISIAPPKDDVELTPSQEELYDALRQWRRHRAAQENCADYMVANNKTLQKIAQRAPKTMRELAMVKGFGSRNCGKYGEEILQVIEAISTIDEP